MNRRSYSAYKVELCSISNKVSSYVKLENWNKNAAILVRQSEYITFLCLLG